MSMVFQGVSENGKPATWTVDESIASARRDVSELLGRFFAFNGGSEAEKFLGKLALKDPVYAAVHFQHLGESLRLGKEEIEELGAWTNFSAKPTVVFQRNASLLLRQFIPNPEGGFSSVTYTARRAAGVILDLAINQ